MEFGCSVPCYHPLEAYHGRHGGLVFGKASSRTAIMLKVPCGGCTGCLLERSRQWALRIVQEMRLHSESAFLTLTYNDNNLPGNGGLEPDVLTKFMKRLRKQRAQGLRFFACGEYGEITQRPHYHVLLLNSSFPDMLFWKESRGHSLYVSAELSRLWTMGDHYIGSVTFESAAYVAGYSLKKLFRGDLELSGREPEFIRMSRNPGIGYEWFRRYGEHAYKRDGTAVNNGHEVQLPRYYDDKFEVSVFNRPIDGRLMFDDRLGQLKVARRRKVNREDNTPERLAVRERVDQLRLEAFKREF